MLDRGALHLLIGPVGAGKSTYARQRIARAPAVFLELDPWMVRLFGADARPADDVLSWYLERRDRCRALMWDLARDVLDAGSDVFMEIGLLARREREAFYEKVSIEDLSLLIYHVDAPRDVRRERVARRNRAADPYTQVVPPSFFEKASDAWEPPNEIEREAWCLIDV